jgi:hypothetical protein
MVTLSMPGSRYYVEQITKRLLPGRYSGRDKKRRMVMKRIRIFASILLCTVVPQIQAQDQCSNSDLRGVYSFVASGTMSGVGAFATAGQTKYDGEGNAAGLIQISLNGNVTPLIQWTGTYNVDPDNCTVTKTANIPGVGTVHFFGTSGDRFKELRFIATDNGTAISGTARKQRDSR